MSIIGLANSIFEEDGRCIIQLAPYKNGRRFSDRSVDASKPALRLAQFESIFKSMPADLPVIV